MRFYEIEINFFLIYPTRLLSVLGRYVESGQILEPRSVNEAENVILGLGLNEVHVCGAKINLGVSLNSILSGHQNHKPVLDKIQVDSQDNAFVIFQSQHEKEINILILDNCQPKDYLKAYITAFMMAFAASKSTTSSARFSDNDCKIGSSVGRCWLEDYPPTDQSHWLGWHLQKICLNFTTFMCAFTSCFC